MGVKTITIDLEACEILSRCKRPGEPSSQTIKARLGQRMTGADLRAAIESAQVSEETLDAIDALIETGKMPRRPAGVLYRQRAT